MSAPDSGHSSTQDRITVMAPDGRARVVTIQATDLTIGRKAGNTIVLDYADVSPQHARVQFDGTNYRVIDLNSTNGTFVGNVRLLPGVPEVWTPDKAVRIGESWLRLERVEAQASATSQTAAAMAGAAARVAAFVESPDLSVDPGDSVVLTVTVLNQGPVVDHLHVSVLNLPAGWLPGPAPAIRLLPGARQSMSLAIAPPRRPESRAGIYPITVRVTSQACAPGTSPEAWPAGEAPDQCAEVQARLTVNPYAQFQVELRPQTVRAGQPAQVRVENQGNTSQTYTLSWQDRAEELDFECQQHELTVPEGQTGSAEFRARARKRAFIGGEKSHSFTAEVASPTGEKQTLTGEAICRAWIPKWLPPLILVPLLAVAAILIALYMQGRKPPTIKSLNVDPLSPVAGQPVTVRWSVEKAETIELRPLVAGLDPAAGQHTFDQGLPAGVSIIFVAHNQYGSTERPLTLTVKEPTPVPTPTLTPTPEPGAPVIEELSASPATITRGQPVTLRWRVINAESVTLEPLGTVATSGQQTDTPQQTTRYSLTASNKGGTVSRSVQVVVDAPVDAPVIEEFSASPSTVVKGKPVTLRWRVSGADSVTLEPLGPVAISGEQTHTPQQTTEYKLNATGKGGTVSQLRRVVVGDPPDLVVTGLSVNPASPAQNANVQATVTVRNQGSGAAGGFVVQWRPYPGHAGLSTSVAGLQAGESKSYVFNYAYPDAGAFDSVAIVDSSNSVAETDEANNSRTLSLNVARVIRRATVTVVFTQITVHDDADPSASGELWLTFNINGQTGRWPSSGTKSVDSGKTYDINKQFTATLSEGDKLSIYVNGTDEDNPGFPLYDANDPLGVVSKEYVSANEWGKGSHSDRSNCPDGCYTIHYTISVTWL